MRVIIWILGYAFITNYLPHLGIDMGSKEAVEKLFTIILAYALILDIWKK